MYNLYPAIGEVNGRRSNYSMAIIEGEKREFGKCDVEIKNKKVEPRESIRGEIARTYMYMDSAYPGRGIISKKIGSFLKLGTRLTLWMNGNVIEQKGLREYRGIVIRWSWRIVNMD